MAQITISGLRKRFGTATAVDGVDLVVENGEVMALLGPSGSARRRRSRSWPDS